MITSYFVREFSEGVSPDQGYKSNLGLQKLSSKLVEILLAKVLGLTQNHKKK